MKGWWTYEFMQHGMLALVFLSMGAAPVGVFLQLRRMSLTGDAMAHAILPGAALGYLVAGLSLPAMTLGGMVAGLTVAVTAGLVARRSALREDSSLAAFYLLSLALGVMLISARGNNVDLLHVLFGNVLALEVETLLFVVFTGVLTVVLMVLLRRPLVLDSFDPDFLKGISRWGGAAHAVFMALMVLNLVAGFHAMGTLLSVGLMVLPAATVRLWVTSLTALLVGSVLLAMGASIAGLAASFVFDWPTSPLIVVVLGTAYVVSMLVAPQGAVRYQLASRHHLEN
ncbi:metal ABC transporter permease [Hydrogenophaga sp. 5NK40-0174]